VASLNRRTRRWIAASLLAPTSAFAWGLATHRMIEEQAVATLPEPPRAFFRAHERELSDFAVEPDTVLRDRYGRAETVRHFIDLDRYGKPPFTDLPRSHHAAVERYGAEVVEERGTVPWTILEFHERLVRDFRAHDWSAGHYVADATMPLHSTSDYDGQKSGSPGIHKAIERDLVDQRLGEYVRRLKSKLTPPTASAYGPDQVFALSFESYASLPELRAAEHDARRRGDFLSTGYLEAFDERAGPLLAARLARAVEFLGAFWLSAWEDSGRPGLPTRAR
jgi:hypothetical protein